MTAGPNPQATLQTDEFWLEAYPFLFPPVSFAECADEVPKIIRLMGSKPGRLLDLCCGPGRHAVPFAAMGFAVTGLDRTGAYLEHAADYASLEGIAVEWIQDDMARFNRPQGFEHVVCLTLSFGLFESARDNRRVLENVFRSLVPGGHFLLEAAGKEVVARTFRESGTTDRGDDGLFIQRRRVADNWNALEMDWLVLRDGICKSSRLRLQLYAASELEALLRDVGFASVTLFGNLDGDPYDQDARALYALAEK